MRILMLWKLYPACLDYFYAGTEALNDLPFEEQRNALLSAHFAGWPGDISRHMQRNGIDVQFVIANAKPMQHRWARENGFDNFNESNWEKRIALAQVKAFRPDILWISSYFDYFGEFLESALSYARRAVAWIGCAVSEDVDVSSFSAILTSHPSMLDPVSDQCKEVLAVTPGFDGDIPGKIRPITRTHDAVFVGNVTPLHERRERILTCLLKSHVELRIFGELEDSDNAGEDKLLHRAIWCLMKGCSFSEAAGYFRKWIAPSRHERSVRAIKGVIAPPVFGVDMYRTLAASRVTINVHVDAAGSRAGNMRMFEATGAGSCLVTEHMDNIEELFVPGKEVVTYSSPEDLVRVVQDLIENTERAEQIAHAGQARTLSCYTIDSMWQKIEPVFDV